VAGPFASQSLQLASSPEDHDWPELGNKPCRAVQRCDKFRRCSWDLLRLCTVYAQKCNKFGLLAGNCYI
jgi:hypothetical protein